MARAQEPESTVGDLLGSGGVVQGLEHEGDGHTHDNLASGGTRRGVVVNQPALSEDEVLSLVGHDVSIQTLAVTSIAHVDYGDVSDDRRVWPRTFRPGRASRWWLASFGLFG